MLTSLVLLLLPVLAGAQTITTVNENLATSTNTLLVDTNANRLDVGTASYTGPVLGAVLFVGSNTVIGTGTGAASEVVIYATGTVVAKGVVLGSGSGATGISTGVVTTAAFTGNGNSSSNLGINSSSVAVFGSFGQLLASSSITASAFFGDGSHLSGVVNLTITVSSITIAAGTAISQDVSSTFSVCQATVSINTTRSAVLMTGSGSIKINTSGQDGNVWVLIDGAAAPGYGLTSSNGEAHMISPITNGRQPMGFIRTVAITPNVTHTFCVGATGGSSAGTYYSPYAFGVLAIP